MTIDLAENELYSDYLFARPSILEGVGRILDLSNSLNVYNASRTPGLADARAVHEDWKAIGHDLRVAMERLGTEAAR